jgi:hypothetical protein
MVLRRSSVHLHTDDYPEDLRSGRTKGTPSLDIIVPFSVMLL